MAPMQDVTIVVVDDDEGHTELVRRNLRRSGINNPIVALTSGMKALDYIFRRDTLVPHRGDDDHGDSGNPGLGLLQDEPGIAVWKLVVQEYGRERLPSEEIDGVIHS